MKILSVLAAVAASLSSAAYASQAVAAGESDHKHARVVPDVLPDDSVTKLREHPSTRSLLRKSGSDGTNRKYGEAAVQPDDLRIASRDLEEKEIDEDFKGCWADDTSDRDLPHLVEGLIGNATHDSCAAACSSHAYFGLQFTQECWCGDSFGKHGNATCVNDCSVGSNFFGNDQNCVYATNTEYHGFQGCWADNLNPESDRDLPHLVESLYLNATHDECLEACSGYAYFGLQWNQECWCGDSYGAYGEADCYDCSVNSTFFGNNQNCVYARPQKLPKDG